VLSNDALQGLIVGSVLGVGSSIASTFAISWIRRTRISINENTTEVEMNYKQLDSDQVAIMEDEGVNLMYFLLFYET
jgi:hypothetical protein